MKTAFIVGVLAVLSASCGGDADCSIDKDCFQGESCLDGLCVEFTPSNSTPNNTVANNTTPGDDSGNTPDVGNQACVVDRVTSECAADTYEPNNTWIDGERISGMMSGCQTTSTFTPLDVTLNATQCSRDEEDWYYIDFFPCVNNDIELIWTVDFAEECADTLFLFDSLSFDCGTEAACTSTQGGAEIRIQIPKTGQRQSQLSYVALKTVLSGFQSDYTVRIQVRQR